MRPDISIGQEEWVEQYLDDHPLTTPDEAQEEWELRCVEAEIEAQFSEESAEVSSGQDFDPDDEVPDWELGLPAPTAVASAGVAPSDGEPAEPRGKAPRPNDPRGWNRLLMNEQGPALDVGGTRGAAPKAPPDRGFNWESEERPPPYAVEADEAGIDPNSPVTYYAERARDGFDSKRSTPYLLTNEDGAKEWRNIGSSEECICEVLSADRPLADWQVALRRGRRSAEASAIRAELAPLVAHLVDVQGAQVKAVAGVLDRGRDAVHALLREGRAKSDT
jgi:hypothetical protein